ncbi:D-glycero-alpha-D-manno-heptose-1,7-bisphosphate 7-phosphatase [Lusitaniella coriacea]|nr:HAD family hydrolase [Lusitaniella coriacea]
MPDWMLPQAILCDRDGTLIEDEHFLHHPEQIRWIPGVLEKLREWKQQGIQIFVITNQSGVARGYFGTEAVEAVHAQLQQDVEQHGGEIAQFYYCPHHPQGSISGYNDPCNCRKPAPGMFLAVLEEHHLQPNRCWVVGDRLRDLEPGIELGMKAFLVETGYGLQAKQELKGKSYRELVTVISSLAYLFDLDRRGDGVRGRRGEELVT